MTDVWTPIIEIFTPERIVSEQAMGADVLVPIEQAVMEQITDGDPNPKFATFVIESGWSRSKRHWGVPVFQSVQEQIANPGDEPIVGYLGHIKPDDDSFAFPDIQFQWLKSKLQQIGDKAKLFTKAYVLPDTKARYYLSRGLAKTVSWRGDCIQRPVKGGVEVSDFKLESIDLARPRKAGMSARLVGALASEMTEEENSVKPEEIAALQENELRAHNPGLVKAIEDRAAEPSNTKVTEMQDEVAKLKPASDKLAEIRTLLGLKEDTDPLDVVKQMAEKLQEAGKTVRDAILEKVLKKNFKDDASLVLVKRVLATEMAGLDLSLDEAHRDDDERKVSEMVSSVIDRDEELKGLVSEMERTPATPTHTGNERGKSDDRYKPGFSDGRIRVKAVS